MICRNLSGIEERQGNEVKMKTPTKSTKLTAILITVALSFSLTACGGSSDELIKKLAENIETEESVEEPAPKPAEKEAAGKKVQVSAENDSDNASQEDDRQATDRELPSEVADIVKSPEKSGDYGKNLKWYYKDGGFFITGEGEMDDYGFPAYWYENDLAEKITMIVIDEGITRIGDNAFRGCINLTKITIPDSVTSIGEWAFSRCDSLTQINIPDSVTDIEGYAFAVCTSLTELTIPDSVTNIGESAFWACENMARITLSDSISNISKTAFSGCICLPDINIPDSVTNIENSAFYDCESLEKITIPDSVTSIGKDAFHLCLNLTEITFLGDKPEGLETTGLEKMQRYLEGVNIYYSGDTFDDFIEESGNGQHGKYWRNATWVRQ